MSNKRTDKLTVSLGNEDPAGRRQSLKTLALEFGLAGARGDGSISALLSWLADAAAIEPDKTAAALAALDAEIVAARALDHITAGGAAVTVRSSGAVAAEARRGNTARRITCDNCHGRRSVKVGARYQYCEFCNGAGYIWSDPDPADAEIGGGARRNWRGDN